MLRDVKDPTLSRQSAHRWGKVVSSTHQLHFTPQKHDYFYCFWYSFLLEAE
jgi:hypothetical protein